MRQPFVLLDDAASGRATLFDDLREVVTCDDPAELRGCLARLRGGDWAGAIGYEAGHELESKLPAAASPAGEPLLWFGRFDRVRHVEADGWLAGEASGAARLGAVQPLLAADTHAAQVAALKAWIAAGDIYQANLTFAASVPVAGCPLALYRRLRRAALAPHGALVFTGRHWLLSLSPELFFSLDEGRLVARPMKGTAARGGTRGDDDARALALAADPKNRAENLMITDLIRNDLSRVGRDVRVPALFEVERYPTVLQMTSTVTAQARDGVDGADVLAALFPCGSITGAPKIRAMEVIGATEASPRGFYTGSIGAIRRDGSARFNVAIRTLVWPAGGCVARLGLGSGIVADSEAGDEWRECLAKAAFLHRAAPPDLIETMRIEGGLLPDLERHLARMEASAGFLGHRWDAARVRAGCLRAVLGCDRGRLRLVLAPSGAHALQVSAMPAAVAEPVAVAVRPLPVRGDDWRLCHKTSDRDFYDAARRAAGLFEVVFTNEQGFLTEGSFTSLFVARGGRLLTPPLAHGLLPGVLRARLLGQGRAIEAPLRPDDLRDTEFFVGNALRGLMRARLAP